MLLLPGSGPTDRDGNSGNGMDVGKTDILKQVAEHLAAHGIASFRYDKRAMLRYKSFWPKSPEQLNKFFSYEHFVNDAGNALTFLKAQSAIDAKRIGVLGHSEGGLFALQLCRNLAKTNQEPWKLVLMSAAGRTFGPVVHDQLEFRLKLANTPDEQAKPFVAWWDAAAEAVAKDKPLPPNQPPQLAPLLNPTVMDLMRAYCRVDPADLFRDTTEPVLILNGSDDTQVSPTKDATRLEEAMKLRKSPATGQLKIISKVSHNYKSTVDGNLDATDGPVSPEALDAMTKFLLSPS